MRIPEIEWNNILKNIDELLNTIPEKQLRILEDALENKRIRDSRKAFQELRDSYKRDKNGKIVKR